MRQIIYGLLILVISGVGFTDERQLMNGTWKGSVEYSDGTKRKAQYIVTTNNNVTEITLEDEADSEFHFNPVTFDKGKITFLWNKDDNNSICTLINSSDSNLFVGECIIFTGLSIKLTIENSLEHNANATPEPESE